MAAYSTFETRLRCLLANKHVRNLVLLEGFIGKEVDILVIRSTDDGSGTASLWVYAYYEKEERRLDLLSDSPHRVQVAVLDGDKVIQVDLPPSSARAVIFALTRIRFLRSMVMYPMSMGDGWRWMIEREGSLFPRLNPLPRLHLDSIGSSNQQLTQLLSGLRLRVDDCEVVIPSTGDLEMAIRWVISSSLPLAKRRTVGVDQYSYPMSIHRELLETKIRETLLIVDLLSQIDHVHIMSGYSINQLALRELMETIFEKPFDGSGPTAKEMRHLCRLGREPSGLIWEFFLSKSLLSKRQVIVWTVQFEDKRAFDCYLVLR